MRSTAIVSIALAAASVAPTLAIPITAATAPDSEAINWKEVGTVAEDAAGVAANVIPFFLKRELEEALLARASAPEDSEAINWKKVGSVAEDVAGIASKLFFKRELEEALLARAAASEGAQPFNWRLIRPQTYFPVDYMYLPHQQIGRRVILNELD